VTGAFKKGLTAFVAAGVFALVSPADARRDPGSALEWSERDGPSGIHVLDGSCVMRVGNLHINITNFGLIGSYPGSLTPWGNAPSAQWPAGSGAEYLWGAGLWVGAMRDNTPHVSTGEGGGHEFRPRDNLQDTIYEARGARIMRPVEGDRIAGRRRPQVGMNDDEDAQIDEEILNGYDDDGDGLIDEDFAQIGDQMMACTVYDNTRLASELYRDHAPLNLRVVQHSYAWSNSDADDYVGFDFEIMNIGSEELEDVYVGFYADCDVAWRADPVVENDLADRFTGLVLADNATYMPVNVYYMHDAEGENTLPGYVGVLFLSHTVDPSGYYAPRTSGVHAYRVFTGQRPFSSGGDPTNDTERYQVLSTERVDEPAISAEEGDWRFVISSGPFGHLSPGRTLRYSVALVAGGSLDELLRNCANAAQSWSGRQYDFDTSEYFGGNDGRESLLCSDEVEPGTGTGIPEALNRIMPNFGDISCMTTGESVGGVSLALIHTASLPEFRRIDDRWCIYVNMDNCTECSRLAGQVCTPDNGLWRTYNCSDNVRMPGEDLICTGINGLETTLRWATLAAAPPPPLLRTQTDDGAVHLFWEDSSEHAIDGLTGQVDFESYRIWRADDWDRPYGSSVENGPAASSWKLIAELDRVDDMIREQYGSDGTLVRRDTLALGLNTGLEANRYVPLCLSDPAYAGLAEAMSAVVAADTLGRFLSRPPLRDRDGYPRPGLEALLPWENEPAVLDTFFMVTGRAEDPALGIVGKRESTFYEYVDREVHNGFLYFYSVTATDMRLRRRGGRYICVGPGEVGDPSLGFTHAVPGTRSWSPEQAAQQQPNIYVYPNPATNISLGEFQRMHPNQDDPTGVRVMFANLPRAVNRIKVFTLDGDLVAEIDHDGRDGYGEASWNLVSRNGQQVVSGIYLFVVQSDDPRFRRFTGKFVLVR
jgi:hypothetical protein